MRPYVLQSRVHQLTFTSIALTSGFILPMIFHLLGMQAGMVFLPMHIPTLICGLICGPFYGFLTGLLSPLISTILSGMPIMYPNGFVMMIELAIYGLVCGYLIRYVNVVFSLLGAMIIGRIVSGFLWTIVFHLMDKPYTISMFIKGAFLIAIPGIIIQLCIIPASYKIIQSIRNNATI